LGAELRDLRRFLAVYQSYATSLQSKIDHLERIETRVGEDIAVYTRYLGQTIAVDPLDRQAKDSKESNTTLFKTWCNRFEAAADFVVYEFVDLEVKLESDEPRSTWLTRPDLWNREHLVVLAGWFGTMNSAPGGMPEVQYAVPVALVSRYPVETAPNVAETDPNIVKPAKNIVKPAPNTVKPAKNIVEPHDQDVIFKVKRHYLRARQFYVKLGRKDQVDRGVISPAIASVQAKQAVTGSRACMLLGREITRQDALTGMFKLRRWVGAGVTDISSPCR
jgi:hypothetical protein